jgi:hypothetical protein
VFPHEKSFPYRKHALIGASLLAMLVGIAAPGQPIGLRIAAPAMVFIAIAGGFLVCWLVLKFQAFVWGRVAPRAVRTVCLCFFYTCLASTMLGIALLPFAAGGELFDGFTSASFALILPAGLGAALGSLRVYSEV